MFFRNLLAYRIDAKNQRIDYTYDSYGRVTQIGNVTYYYDTFEGGPTYGWGRLVAVRYPGRDSGSFITETYAYTRGGAMYFKQVRMPYYPGVNFNAWFAYDSEGGYLGPWKYPGGYSPEYTYTLDGLSRPVKLVASPLNPGDDPQELVKEVIYGPGGEITQIRMKHDSATNKDLVETRVYNTLGQLTRLTMPGRIDQEYRYADGQNNGRITQMKDWISGEEVSYSYDSLNRLVQAVTTGPEYGLTFSYDGFGNMTRQHAFKGPAFETNLGYNGLTNRITSAGYQYDANGNLTAMPYLTMKYNAQNQMIESTLPTGGTTDYGYDASGRQVWSGQSTSRTQLDFYGPDGRLLSECKVEVQYGTGWIGDCTYERVYLAGQLIRVQTAPYQEVIDGIPVIRRNSERAASPDRLGSRGKYYPYGYLREGGAPLGGWQYATYTRDSTGLDNAIHRHYASAIGRFTTPDPYRASAAAANPQSWNRYAYVLNDPVNFSDPAGLDAVSVEGGQYTFSITAYSSADPIDSLTNTWGPATGIWDWLPDSYQQLVKDLPRIRGTRRIIHGLLAEAAEMALRALDDPECAGLFNTDSRRPHRYGPKEVLSAMLYGRPLGGTYIGRVTTDRIPLEAAAVTDYDKRTYVPTGVSVRAMSADIVLQSNPFRTPYWTLTTTELAETLLHELGHVFDIVASLGGSKIVYDVNPDGSINWTAQENNEKLLREHCNF